MAVRVQIRRGTASEWEASNPILLDGEFAIEKDTRKFKIGDGVTNWNGLLYATQGELGKSIQYVWDGTRLGIKQEGESVYQYVDLKGATGETGTQGVAGSVPIEVVTQAEYDSLTPVDDTFYYIKEV